MEWIVNQAAPGKLLEHEADEVLRVKNDFSVRVFKYFLMQGDGSLVAKEECLASDIVGKVHHVIRLSGKVIPVDSWEWRLLSRLWRGLGILRVSCLRVLHKLFLT